MKITNTTKGDIGLSPAHIVPAGGSIDIDNAALTKLKALPSVKGHFTAGRLSESGAVEATAPTMPGAPADNDRAEELRQAVAYLSDEDFTAAGKPDVRPMNVILDDNGHEPTTAAERDAFWEQGGEQG